MPCQNGINEVNAIAVSVERSGNHTIGIGIDSDLSVIGAPSASADDQGAASLVKFPSAIGEKPFFVTVVEMPVAWMHLYPFSRQE